MSLFLHLFLHILLSIVIGYFVWKQLRNGPAAFLAAFAGGVLIDLDHLIDYFLAFGFSFNPLYFLQGYQFLASDKIYVLFHGWEYVILLGAFVWLYKRNTTIRSIACSLCLGAFLHLLIDVNVNNGMTLRSYSLIYRATQKFELRKIVTPEHYQKHQEEKKGTIFNQ